MFVPIPGRSVDEVGVALRAVQELAHDEQRPPLADHAERVCDRAVLVVALHFFTFCTMNLRNASGSCKFASTNVEREGTRMVTSPRLKWFALALLAAVQFMVVLDIAIVNVALPSIQTDLGFSQANLQWVISAYALVFGGFLLLGGRTADILGRRRVFMVGLVVVHDRLAALRAGLVRGLADRRPRDPGSRRCDDLARRARDPDDHVRRGPASGTSRSASGARSAASAPPRASCSAACSPTLSPGSGSSSSTSRSGSRRWPWRRCCSPRAVTRAYAASTRPERCSSRAG